LEDPKGKPLGIFHYKFSSKSRFFLAKMLIFLLKPYLVNIPLSFSKEGAILQLGKWPVSQTNAR
jgi:ABC-type spermidine/putrescine transport system permease subunit II